MGKLAAVLILVVSRYWRNGSLWWQERGGTGVRRAFRLCSPAAGTASGGVDLGVLAAVGLDCDWKVQGQFGSGFYLVGWLPLPAESEMRSCVGEGDVDALGDQVRRHLMLTEGAAGVNIAEGVFAVVGVGNSCWLQALEGAKLLNSMRYQLSRQLAAELVEEVC